MTRTHPHLRSHLPAGRTGRLRRFVAAVLVLLLALGAQGVPASAVAPPPLPQDSTAKTFAAGSYIIDMGYMGTSVTGVQPKAEGLQPYGLIYHLTVDRKIPVFWVIANGKEGTAAVAPALTNPDLTTTVKSPYTSATTTTKSYYSSAMVISAEFMTDDFLTTILTTQGLTAVRVDKATASFTAPVYDEINYWPRATLDSQNGSIAADFYTNAKITGPASGATPAILAASKSYTWKAPSQLTPCDDVFVMPHADPTWATHQRLLSWNDEENGYIWAGCHAVSVLENVDSLDAGVEPNMNFLSTEGLLDYGDHGDGTIPYYYGVERNVLPWQSLTVPGTGTLGTEPTDRSDPIMQFIGATALAHQNGSEQIYMPNPESKYPGLTGTSQWRDGARVIAWDPTQADVVAGDSPGIAAAAVYGRAFDDPTNGLVMYEGGHSINKGTIGDTPAQRAFFNFLLMSAIESAPNVTVDRSNMLANTPSGASVALSATVADGSPSYKYEWRSSCGGTFSNGSGTTNPGTISTTWTAPTVNVPTDCQIRAVVVDSCQREVFDAESTVVQPLADVAITKTSSAAVVPMGENFTYTLTATNNGPATASGVVVTDILPDAVTYVSATPAATVAGRTLTWNIGSLAKGASTTITVTVTATTGGVSALNEAEITSTTPDADLSNNTATNVTKIVKSGVEITKVARPEIVPASGGPVTYEYVVRNTGDNPLSNVTVTDNPTCTITGPEGDLNGDGLLNEPYLGVDREIWRYTCTKTVNSGTGDVGTTEFPKDTPDNPTTKQNVATVSATDAAGLVISDSDAATVSVAAPAITVTKMLEPAGQLPAPGQDATFRITVKNDGNVPLTGVSTTDGWPGTCSVATIPTLAAGESYSYVCSATTPASPTLTTVATDTLPTIAYTNNTGTGWVTDWIDSQADGVSAGNIRVVAGLTPLSGPALPAGYSTPNVISYAGNKQTLLRQVNLSGVTSASVRFLYQRSNDFNNDSRNLNVYASADGVAWTLLSSITPTGSNSDDTTWTTYSYAIPANLLGSGTRIRFGDANVDLSGRWVHIDNVEIVRADVINTVSATGFDPFGTQKTATDTEAVMPGTPSLAITKTASKAGPLRDGESMTYTVTVTNTGTVQQTGVTVTDALPAGLSSVSGSVRVTKPAYTLTTTDNFGVAPAETYTGTGSGWASNAWTESETPLAQDATAGQIQIVNNSGNSASAAYFDGNDTQLKLTRPVNLAGASSATLTFQCSRESFTAGTGDANDALAVYVGGQLVTTVDSATSTTLCPTSNGGGYATAGTFTIPADGLRSPATVELRVTGNRKVYVDNLTITASYLAAANVTAGDPPALTSAGGPYVLPVGQSVTFTVPVTVTGAPADGFQFSNVASATSSQQSAPVSAAVSTRFLDPSFSITKTARETWVNFANKTVTYEVVVQNTGNSDLTPVSVSDPFCDAPLAGPTGDFGGTGGTGGAADGVLQVGETWRYTCTNEVTSPYNETNLDPDPDVPDTVTNTVTATFKDSAGVQLAPKTATADVKVLNPSMLLTVDPASTTILSGGTVSYTYTLDNTGDVAITNPSVTPSNCTPAIYHDGDTDNDRILDIEETWTFTCTTVPLTTDVSGATVTASGNALIFNTLVTDEVDVAVNVNVINPAIAVDKKVYDATFMTAGQAVDALAESPLEVGVSNDIVYLYTVTNPGDVPLAVTLTDDHTATPPVYVSGDSNNDGKLDPTETWYYTYDANLVDGGYSGLVTGTVVAVGAYDVGTAPNNAAGTVSASDLTNVRVLKPELILLKEVDAEYVSLGTSVTYHYTVRNTGQTTFAPSGIGPRTDDTCSPVTQDDFAGTPLDANNNGKLDPGEDLHYSCTSVMDALTDGTTSYSVLNTFTVGLSTDDRGGTYTPTPAVAQVFVVNPGVTVTKTAASGTVTGDNIVGEPGDPVVYTVEVRHTLSHFDDNRDSLNALALTVTDPTCSPATPITYLSGDDLDVNGLLNPGETHTYTCTLASLPDGDPTVNTVTVTGTPTVENVAPVVVTDTATVTPNPIVVTVLKRALNCDVGVPVCSLPGAEFTLYTADPLGPGPVTGEVLAFSPSAPGDFTASLVVNRDYWLVESRAPEGFQLLAQPVKFRLVRDDPADDAVLTLDAGASGLITAQDYTITVVNVPAVGLPKVGGDGPVPYLAIGLLLLAGAGLYYHLTARPPIARGRAM